MQPPPRPYVFGCLFVGGIDNEGSDLFAVDLTVPYTGGRHCTARGNDHFRSRESKLGVCPGRDQPKELRVLLQQN